MQHPRLGTPTPASRPPRAAFPPRERRSGLTTPEGTPPARKHPTVFSAGLTMIPQSHASRCLVWPTLLFVPNPLSYQNLHPLKAPIEQWKKRGFFCFISDADVTPNYGRLKREVLQIHRARETPFRGAKTSLLHALVRVYVAPTRRLLILSTTSMTLWCQLLPVQLLSWRNVLQISSCTDKLVVGQGQIEENERV